MANELTGIEHVVERSLKCVEEAPTIILGSGSSMAYGLPSMTTLSSYIIKNIGFIAKKEDRKVWAKIKRDLNLGKDLETSLDRLVNSNCNNLLDRIIHLTWRCINGKDTMLMKKSTLNKQNYSIEKLISLLFRTCNTEIDIITTNYDRAVEYACNSLGFLFQTGFPPGYIQGWEQAESVQYLTAEVRRQSSRVVNIYKVHGSLDWYKTADNRIMCLPSLKAPSSEFSPLIVTPGLKKYQQALEDPFRAMLTNADKAIKESKSLLCVGYGFRDEHIHPKIRNICRTENVPIVVLAKNLTKEAKEFLTQSAGERYMGIEECSQRRDACRVHVPGNEFSVPNPKLWSLSNFCDLIQ